MGFKVLKVLFGAFNAFNQRGSSLGRSQASYGPTASIFKGPIT